MPRFAILTHDHPHLHWDLLLEVPGQETLRTWRLEKPPAPGEIIQAETLPDHRRIYLDYEGPISKGRGEVKQWDGGEYEALSQTATEIILRFEGTRLQGEAVLHCDELGAWTFAQT
jgi:hypothetical protein